MKLAHKHVQTCVVGGWRPEVGAAGGESDRIGALLLGVWEGGATAVDGGSEEAPRLRFAGRVGSGLVAAGPQADLVRLLRPLRRDGLALRLARAAGGRRHRPLGGSRRSSSRSATWAAPRAAGCGSRCSAASGRTSSPPTPRDE